MCVTFANTLNKKKENKNKETKKEIKKAKYYSNVLVY